ncbi:uncharacterized protein si:ch211-79k12.1 isoform X2 [Syngnathoides biaculeatus]|uniref:uncharacterized protein si:ch211-79k12.1 isoform X2 n=1 Tax=Syngnathoides biaculeatus TaxID=300417 RepID=UPI002ADE7A16|nr:uncharacterized protein si:ch211-79k12.1 isoform X2 [Syngnathoides biaculeatus]
MGTSTTSVVCVRLLPAVLSLSSSTPGRMWSLQLSELLIRGPNHNIIEGDSVTLECLYSDNAFDISRVSFESFSEILGMWRPVWRTSWCFYDLNVEEVDDRLVLHVPHVAHFAEGVFRCVSDDPALSAPNNASKTLSFIVHYLGEVYLSREGLSNFLGLPGELRVLEGDDVVLQCSSSSSEEPNYCWYKEGDDWILPSSVMTLKKVSAMDSGVYTCTVEHPTVLLEKMRNISLIVLPENTIWFDSYSGPIVLTTSLMVAFGLVVFVAVLTTWTCHRNRSVNIKPIDDRSQIQPIYKNSAQAPHSNGGDKQPLFAV